MSKSDINPLAVPGFAVEFRLLIDAGNRPVLRG